MRRLVQLLFSFLIVIGLMMPSISDAKKSDEKGVEVKVTVLDEEGKVIPTAVIRHPEEQFRHPVNTFDGSWADRVLYLPDGRELVFEKGLELELEISAPGYVNQHVIYVVKKKKNNLAVTLQKMEFSFDQDLIDEPVIQFGRDKPLDGAPIEDE